MPNFDPILHQWKLFSSGTEATAGNGNIPNTGGGGGGHFLGFFATLAKQGSAPQLPLSVRFAFRPVLTTPPNTSLLLEAMLLTSGFAGARALVQGLIHGLRELRRINLADQGNSHGKKVTSSIGNGGARALPTGGQVPTTAAAANRGTSGNGTKDFASPTSADSAMLLQDVVANAVRTAAGLLELETAREMRAARRKLGLASLTSSERKEKTDGLSRAVEARVLIAGVARALLSQEMGGRLDAMGSRKKKRGSSSRSGSGTTSPAGAAPKGTAATSKEATAPKDSVELEIDARRAEIVSTLQQTEILREILKPLEDMAVRLMGFSSTKLDGSTASNGIHVIRRALTLPYATNKKSVQSYYLASHMTTRYVALPDRDFSKCAFAVPHHNVVSRSREPGERCPNKTSS